MNTVPKVTWAKGCHTCRRFIQDMRPKKKGEDHNQGMAKYHTCSLGSNEFNNKTLRL